VPVKFSSSNDISNWAPAETGPSFFGCLRRYHEARKRRKQRMLSLTQIAGTDARTKEKKEVRKDVEKAKAVEALSSVVTSPSFSAASVLRADGADGGAQKDDDSSVASSSKHKI